MLYYEFSLSSWRWLAQRAERSRSWHASVQAVTKSKWTNESTWKVPQGKTAVCLFQLLFAAIICAGELPCSASNNFSLFQVTMSPPRHKQNFGNQESLGPGKQIITCSIDLSTFVVIIYIR